MNKQWKLSVGAAVLGMSFGANAGIVDLFSVSQTRLTDTTTGDGGLTSQVSDALDPGSILTGYRDIGVELDTDPLGNDAYIQVVNGVLSFNTGSGATGTGIVQWDGDDTGSSVLTLDGVTLDLTEGGTLGAFEIKTIFSDLGYEFLVGAYTSATEWTVISFSATEVPLTLPDGVTTYIPFSGFTNALLCGAVNPAPGVNSITCGSGNTSPVDFAKLDALELIIDPNGSTVSIDLSLNSIRTVPEPGVLALMGMGLLAAGFASRRRKSQV